MYKNPNIIKTMNLNKVREALKEMESATKPQLAKKTGLSVVTVNALVNTLIESGEIMPYATLDSEGGRPAAAFMYNRRYQMVLVVYMHEQKGADMAFYGVVDLCGTFVDQVEQKLLNVTLESFDDNIRKMLEHYPQIKGICFGVPGGEVDQTLVVSDYEGLRGKSLSKYIQEKYALPVVVENDINAAVAGYVYRNNIDSSQCVIGLYFPDKYPPGAGIYLNGDVFRGRNGLAGEIKHLPFGVDWETFDFNMADVNDYIIKTIKAFMCMFNPNTIVLYGERSEDYGKLLLERCTNPVEKILLPQVINSREISSDFQAGIKILALKMIEKEY